VTAAGRAEGGDGRRGAGPGDSGAGLRGGCDGITAGWFVAIDEGEYWKVVRRPRATTTPRANAASDTATDRNVAGETRLTGRGRIPCSSCSGDGVACDSAGKSMIRSS